MLREISPLFYFQFDGSGHSWAYNFVHGLLLAGMTWAREKSHDDATARSYDTLITPNDAFSGTYHLFNSRTNVWRCVVLLLFLSIILFPSI